LLAEIVLAAEIGSSSHKKHHPIVSEADRLACDFSADSGEPKVDAVSEKHDQEQWRSSNLSGS